MYLTQKIINQIKDYLIAESRPLLCVVGPTATGKTGFSVEIAKHFNGELINADSRQIYKGIECITGLDYDEIKDVPNHLFGIKETSEIFTLSDFLNTVRDLIKQIHGKGKLPIIVGGTGLFVSSLIEGFEIPEGSFDEDLRKTFKNKTSEELYEELKKVDPKSIDKIHVNNRVRIERALEVFYSTGKQKSDGKKSKEQQFNALIFCKKIPETKEERGVYYEKVNERQGILFKKGFEQFKILNLKFKISLPSLTAIGFSELDDYFSGKITKEEAIKKMQQAARNYAKRQMTWWRKKENINYID